MNNLRQILNISVSLDYDDKEIKSKVKKKYGLDLKDYKILERSLDARRNELKFNVKIGVVYKEKIEGSGSWPEPYQVKKGSNKDMSIAIIGFGPAGIFASHILSQAGYHVTVYERGGKINKRNTDIAKFLETRELNENSNISFGEGGAGTYSDGKLTSRSKDVRKEYVKDLLYSFGAPSDIKIMHKPHIGTDIMRKVIYNFRKELEKNEVEIKFDSKVQDILIENGQAKGIIVDDRVERYDRVILAVGNAARDTFETLIASGVQLEGKNFSVGFRIEHRQSFVDRAQFKTYVGHRRLFKGEYSLTANIGDKGVYSFCMCPGGLVVPSASERGHLSVNGMSYHDRAEPNANSAIVRTINGITDPIKAINYQREIEKKAFEMAGGDYTAPAIHIKDFISKNKAKKQSDIKASYPLGVKFMEIDEIFERGLCDDIRQGLIEMDKKMPGFIDDALITAPETKTSSPVRINRDDRYMTNIKGLYACGEGAGYAGGIVSAALDGLKCAEKITEEANGI